MKKYLVIVTSEDDRYGTVREDGSVIGLGFYADCPYEGNLEATVVGDTADEIYNKLTQFEGFFYLLLNLETMERIASGIIDYEYPRTEIEEYEAEQNKGTVTEPLDFGNILDMVDTINSAIADTNAKTAELKEQFHKAEEERFNALLTDLKSIVQVMEEIEPFTKESLCIAIGDIVCVEIHTWCAKVTLISDGSQEPVTKTIRLDREQRYRGLKSEVLTALLDAWFLPESQEIIKSTVFDYAKDELEKKAKAADAAYAEAKERS